jgi:hypothetical protein
MAEIQVSMWMGRDPESSCGLFWLASGGLVTLAPKPPRRNTVGTAVAALFRYYCHFGRRVEPTKELTMGAYCTALGLRGSRACRC